MTAAAAPTGFIDWGWVSGHLGLIASAVGQHAELSGIAIGVGFVISIPASIAVWRFHRLRGPVLGVAGLLYTVPSVALFALIQPLTGYFSITTAEIALVSYTLLILVRNTLVGLDGVPAEVREAARALGYGGAGELLHVDLPLALPSIFAGLRVATVTTVGLVTVTAFIGQGGLGQLIINGFDNFFPTPILVGLLGSVLLAGLGDSLLVAAERALVPWSQARARLR